MVTFSLFPPKAPGFACGRRPPPVRSCCPETGSIPGRGFRPAGTAEDSSAPGKGADTGM